MRTDTNVFINGHEGFEADFYPDGEAGPFATVCVRGTETDFTIFFDTVEDAEMLALVVSEVMDFFSNSKPVRAEKLAEGGERNGDA